jgi:hypothetical protein
MDGRIGIGAPFWVTPLVHVARLVAAGRCLGGTLGAAELAAGDGAGDRGCVVVCCGTAGALSRATSDRRSHDDVFEPRLGEASGESLADNSDGLRPNNLDEEDLSRRGSTASWKNSCASACADVGLARGSQSKHQVTNCDRLAGHCGLGSIVSNECGAIFGKEKPSFCANLTPSFHSPPPTRWPYLLTQPPGLPMISHTLHTWSTSLPPGNSGLRVAISTAMAPTAHMSTGAE